MDPEPQHWSGHVGALRGPKASAMPRSSLSAVATRTEIVAHTAEVEYQVH